MPSEEQEEYRTFCCFQLLIYVPESLTRETLSDKQGNAGGEKNEWQVQVRKDGSLSIDYINQCPFNTTRGGNLLKRLHIL